MGVFNGVFPIQAGREADARAFAAETSGARARGATRSTSHRSASRVRRGVAGTPMGSLMVVWFEGDVEKAFADLATNDSEFSTWFRGKVLDITGVDLAAPSDAEPPAILIDYRA